MTTMRADRRRALGLTGIGSILAGAVLAVTGFSTAGAASVDPVDFTADNNPTCAQVLAPASPVYEFKIDSQPANGVYPFTEAQSGIVGGGTVTISNAGVVSGVFEFDFSSTTTWDAVIVKQGNGASVFYYDPEVSADTDLYPSKTNKEPTGGISHVTFCRDGVVTTSSSTTESTTTTTEGTTTTTEGTTTTTEEQTTTSVLGVVVERPATPQAPAPAPAVQAAELPRTGDNDLTMAMIGLGLIMVGGGLVLVTRESLIA